MAATYNGKIVVNNAFSGQFLHRITQDDLDDAISQGLSFGQLSLGEVSTDNFTFEDRSPILPENTVSIDQVPADADLFITVEFGLVQLPDAVVFKPIQGTDEYIATYNGKAINQNSAANTVIDCPEQVVNTYIEENTPLSDMGQGALPFALVNYIDGSALNNTNTILRESIAGSLMARKDNIVGYIPQW